MSKCKFILVQNFFTRQWRWKLVAGNGRTLDASSEGFFNKKNCIENAKKTGEALVELTRNL
ncbi:hypothetical protein [Flavobacterium sp. 25HG05S-40]|uniref:hypothetical protein n=1 Tax=Flavobacterium sp. 25HG05S-40 TaxID=3458682 RepID=UPI004043E39F